MFVYYKNKILNLNHIVKVEFQQDQAIFHLTDGTTTEITGTANSIRNLKTLINQKLGVMKWTEKK